MSSGARRISWPFFKARAKRRYLDHNGRESPAAARTGKQPIGRAPEDCVEKWVGQRKRIGVRVTR